MTEQDRQLDGTSHADWDALARYVAGESTPQESATLRRVFEANPSRAALIGALDAGLCVRDHAPPTALEVEEALASVRSRRVESASLQARHISAVALDAHRGRWRRAPLLAAAMMLVVAGAGLMWRGYGSTRSFESAASRQKHFATPVGVLDSLLLGDGTRVLLGPGSALTLADRFGAAAREVTLEGQARFDVVHDPARSFVVHTSAASFRDIGTSFAVQSDAARGAQIVVTHGEVAVQGTSGGASVTLRAGDRATVAREGEPHVERASVTSEDLAWTSGRLVFRDAQIAQVVADLRRWYGIELDVDSALATKRLNVTFGRASAATVGPILAAMLGGRLERQGTTLRIVSQVGAHAAAPSR